MEVCQQYDQGQESLAPASQSLLQKPLQTILGLPHNEKLQWLLSIKAARQRQWTAWARIATAQHWLMEQLYIRGNNNKPQ